MMTPLQKGSDAGGWVPGEFSMFAVHAQIVCCMGMRFCLGRNSHRPGPMGRGLCKVGSYSGYSTRNASTSANAVMFLHLCVSLSAKKILKNCRQILMNFLEGWDMWLATTTD